MVEEQKVLEELDQEADKPISLSSAIEFMQENISGEALVRIFNTFQHLAVVAFMRDSSLSEDARAAFMEQAEGDESRAAIVYAAQKHSIVRAMYEIESEKREVPAEDLMLQGSLECFYGLKSVDDAYTEAAGTDQKKSFVDDLKEALRQRDAELTAEG